MPRRPRGSSRPVATFTRAWFACVPGPRATGSAATSIWATAPCASPASIRAFRFGPFSGGTHHYAPVCLNSLLYRYERDLSHLAHVLGEPADALRWDRRAKARNAAMQRYLWRPREGVFADYDFVYARPSSYAYITSLYPLWAGVATPGAGQADRRATWPFRTARRVVDEQDTERHAVG